MMYNPATSTAPENVVIGGGVAENGDATKFVLDFTVHTISSAPTFTFVHFPVKYAGGSADEYDTVEATHQVVALMDVVTDSSANPWIVAVTQSATRAEALKHGYFIIRLKM